MNLYDTIMKDVVMAEVFESDKPMILIDMEPLLVPMQEVVELTCVDFDTTLFINGMLNFASNRYTHGQELATFLQNNLLKINKEYSSFDKRLRLEKMRALAEIMGKFRDTGHTMQHLFVRQNLYNHSGILKIDTVDASILSCVVAKLDNRKWTQDFKNSSTYSISGTPLEYLGRILRSA